MDLEVRHELAKLDGAAAVHREAKQAGKMIRLEIVHPGSRLLQTPPDQLEVRLDLHPVDLC